MRICPNTLCVTINGVTTVDQRFAQDWSYISPTTGQVVQGDVNLTKNYLGYGKELFAIADGTVVCRDAAGADFAENAASFEDSGKQNQCSNHEILLNRESGLNEDLDPAVFQMDFPVSKRTAASS